MKSDLERRIAYLERAVIDTSKRMSGTSTLLDYTRERVRLGQQKWRLSTGSGITVFCCGSLELPAVLKLRQPDDTLVDLTWNGSGWAGETIVPMVEYKSDKYNIGWPRTGNILQVGLRYYFYCGVGPPGFALRVQGTGDKESYPSGQYELVIITYPQQYPIRPDTLVTSHALVQPPINSEKCDPFNVVFINNTPYGGHPNIGFFSYFKWSFSWGSTASGDPKWIVYAP